MGVFTLSARFALVYNGAQTSGRNCKAEEVIFQCSSSAVFFVSQTLGDMLDCISHPLSVFRMLCLAYRHYAA